MFFLAILVCLIILIIAVHTLNNYHIKSQFTPCELYKNADAACTGCIDNTTNCTPGYYRLNDSCVPCPMGSYCNSGTKYDCGSNYVSDYMSISSSNCQCMAGYYKQGTGCIECPTGSYCPLGNTGPVSCGAGKTSESASMSNGDCKCPEGYYKNFISGDCIQCGIGGEYCSGISRQLCPIGYYCMDGLKTLCPDGKSSGFGTISPNDCYFNCNRGSYILNNTCTDCPVGSYCPDGLIKKICPGTTSTDGKINMTKISDCICSTGYFLNPTNNRCENVSTIISSYPSNKRFYSRIQDVFHTVSPMSIGGAPEFNFLRIMASNAIRNNTPVFADESLVIPSNDNIKGFYCRIINIYNYFGSSNSVTINRIILLDVNNNIINSSFRFTAVSGAYISQGNYDDKFQDMNELNFIMESGINISLVSVDEIDVKVYKLIITIGNGDYNTTTIGTAGLAIRITNNTMYNNLNLTSNIPDPLEETTGVKNPENPNGIEFDVRLVSNRELYKWVKADGKAIINEYLANPSNRAKFLALKKLTELGTFAKSISKLKLPITIPIVYPVDFDKKRIVFKSDGFVNIPLNSIFTIYFQDEYWYLVTGAGTGLKTVPDYPPEFGTMPP